MMYENETDIRFMEVAVLLAKKAESLKEVPVGAVVVYDGKIIGQGYNLRETKQCSLCHAEISAIAEACEQIGSWRLEYCTLYVTLEPCPMCAGAIINARIPRVVFGAFDSKAGCFGSVTDLTLYPFNHKPLITSGVLKEKCGLLLTDFFKGLRNNKINTTDYD